MSSYGYLKQFSGSAKDFGRVAVLMGGNSAEREISLQSGNAILRGLRENNIEAVAIDVDEKILSILSNTDADRVFIALHGAGGEDGRIQALLEWLNLPYTGSGVQASALAMDKLKTKLIWRGSGLPTPEFDILTPATDFSVVLEKLGGQCFVKPVGEGSSIGMRCVDTTQDLRDAYHYASNFHSEVIAESRIVGREFTVAILNEVALPVIELKVKNVFYDYDAKYLSGKAEYICPTNLSEKKMLEIETLALKAFHVLGCKSWGRIDFMQDEAGVFYLLEANTVPGMTAHSLVPIAAKTGGLQFNEVLQEILVATL